MVTAAVLGAAVGVGAALVLTLTLLIYRYHAAQKKEAADYYPHHRSSGGNYSNSWSTRDSWAPAPAAPTPPPTYKSTSCLLDGAPSGRRRPPSKLYLPLNVHHQHFETADRPVQPPVPSLAPYHSTSPNDSPSTTLLINNMSSSSGGGSHHHHGNAAASGGGNSNKRSSPLNYFSLDIPASLLGSSSASSSGGGGGGSGGSSLPHQSCSLPFVARLVRTPSTSSASSHGTSHTASHDSSQQDQQNQQQQTREMSQGRSEGVSQHQYPRSPSPSCRSRLATSPTPLLVGGGSGGGGATPSSSTAAAAAGHLGGNSLNLTPYPSPLMSPAPSFSSLLNSLTSATSSACTSPVPPPTPASPLVRRSRSPMLCTLSKMNSIQSSTSTTSNQSQGSTTSLCCPATPAPMATTPTPLGALQPDLYKRETTIHVGLPSGDEQDPSDHSTNDSSSSDYALQSAYSQQVNAGSSSGAASSSSTSSGTHRGSLAGRSSSAVPLGRLHFRLSYDFDKSDLLVHLIEARDLSQTTNLADGSGSTSSSSGGSCSSTSGATNATREAHVRLLLQPEVDQRRRQSTRSLRLGVDTQCFFDERFKFPVSHDQLADKTLRFQICEYDRFSRPCVVGDLQFSLADRESVFGCSSTAPGVDIWADVMRNTLPDESRPQLLISLSYLPSAERLTVVVLKAKNLVVPANKENIDPLVKLYLMANGKRLKKKKTECRKGTCHPVWNQALAFTVPAPKLHSCTLEISVVDHGSDRGGKSAQLGCLALGPDQNPSSPERQHWQDMAHNVRKSIAMWHYLH